MSESTVTPQTPPDEAQRILQRQRLAIVERCKQIRIDSEEWNRLHPGEELPTIDMDFTADLDEIRRARRR